MATEVTRSYDQFSMIDTNREPSRAHIENIKKSMEENGNFTEYSPILVNERGQIIDGQHRFLACKELGLPVFYTEAPNTSIHEARKMNILNKNWSTKDFAHSYSTEGLKPYMLYNELREDYPEIGHSVLLYYIAGPVAEDGLHADFRGGNLHLSLDNYDDVTERLDNLMDLVRIDEKFKSKSLAVALLKAMTTDVYDHERMIAKVKQLQSSLAVYMNMSNNLRQLEDIFNNSLSASNKVRFF